MIREIVPLLSDKNRNCTGRIEKVVFPLLSIMTTLIANKNNMINGAIEPSIVWIASWNNHEYTHASEQ